MPEFDGIVSLKEIEMNDMQEDLKKFRERVNSRDTEQKKKRYYSRWEQMGRDANVFYRFWVQVVIAAYWVWWNILRPASNAVWWLVKKFVAFYRRLWSFFVYRRDKYGELTFSKVRAGMFLILSIPTLLVTTNLIVDGAIFGVSYRANETVYLFDAADNSFLGDDEFSITGCEVREIPEGSGFECKSEDTLYFRIQPGLIEHIYAIFTRGNIFYGDTVAAVVAPGWNKCVVDSWYFRFKTLMRNTNIYPRLLVASCQPVMGMR